LFIAVDQEGGTVERLHTLIGSIPPAMAFAACGRERLAREVHESHARILQYLGFNVNFVPVLDLSLSGSNNGLGTRCFSDDPRIVVRFARAVLAAHNKANILVCGKHFPGLGATDLDSHLDLPTVLRKWKKVLKEDLIPYKKLMDLLPFIMVNHALYPEMNRKLPASLSKEITAGFLLKKCNYPGLSVSDDLIMGAVSSLYNLPEAAEHALLAGNHMFLICRPEGVLDAYNRLLKRASHRKDLQQSIFQSCSRILAGKFGHLEQAAPRIAVSREIKKMRRKAEETSLSAITWLRGKPIGKAPATCTVYVPQTKWIRSESNALSEYLTSRGTAVRSVMYPIDLEPQALGSVLVETPAEWIMIVLANSSSHEGQRVLLSELLRRNKKVGVISGAYPDDFIPETVTAAVASYWTSPSALRAAGLVLAGERKSAGRFPVGRR
jgi:beta-N-acetylhexosaminidase